MLPLSQYPQTSQSARQLSPEEVAEAIRMYEAVKATQTAGATATYTRVAELSDKLKDSVSGVTDKKDKAVNPLSGKARINRLVWWVAAFPCLIAGNAMFTALSATNKGIGALDFIAFCLFAFGLFLSAHRFHDLGKRGWWSLVPIYGFIMCGFVAGQPHDNKYGKAPE
jgi:uncharacterized membrane protein YhaH (DUF805 family)